MSSKEIKRQKAVLFGSRYAGKRRTFRVIGHDGVGEMAQQSKTSNVVGASLARAGGATKSWWWALAAAQRRSFCAVTTGLLALVMLIGLLPSAQGSWVAVLGVPVIWLCGWGAALALLGVLAFAIAVVAEAVMHRAFVRAGWLWCAAAALFLLLTESRLIFGSPLGGVAGALGAFVLRRIPATAAQLIVVGGFLIDAFVAFRVSWHEVRQVGRWVTRRPPERSPLIPPLTSAAPVTPVEAETPAMASHTLPPNQPFSQRGTPSQAQALPAYEGIERIYVSSLLLDLGGDGALEALRVPAYLRHGPLATNRPGPTGPQPPDETILRPKMPPLSTAPGVTPARAEFTLPPLPLRRPVATESQTPPDADPMKEIAEILNFDRSHRGTNVVSAATAGTPVATPPVRMPRSETYPATWALPPLSLLNRPPESRATAAQEHALQLAGVIERTLKSFGVEAEVRRSDISVGPTIIRFGIRPLERTRTDERGRALVDGSGSPITVRTRVSRIMNLKDDLALVLEVKTLRMEAPVPERPYIGVEIPNSFGHTVSVREILESEEFGELAARSKLAVVLGRDVAGRVRVGDLARFPHVLVAGATGAGKSVCLNAIVSSLIAQATPAQVRLIMIDPKMVELMMYDGIPHLLAPVITDPRMVVGVLDAAIDEMERRYRLFSRLGVRNLDGYERLRTGPQGSSDLEPLPRIVLIIDELADLMMVAADDVERQICRLAQLARAIGIHLVVATQRPSVDVITGLIKANIPTRIAFMTSSAVDSRTILDAVGAEKLLGKGDMLYLASDAAKAERIQGAYVADDEVERLARFWRKQADALGIVPAQWEISVEYDADIS